MPKPILLIALAAMTFALGFFALENGSVILAACTLVLGGFAFFGVMSQASTGTNKEGQLR